jgi:hypothetical protein
MFYCFYYFKYFSIYVRMNFSIKWQGHNSIYYVYNNNNCCLIEILINALNLKSCEPYESMFLFWKEWVPLKK